MDRHGVRDPVAASPSDYPFSIAGGGRAALTLGDDHVRDMIEQVLFTAPGERVMLPEFGCGLLTLDIRAQSELLAAATELLVRGSLQRWLSYVIDVSSVSGERRGTNAGGGRRVRRAWSTEAPGDRADRRPGERLDEPDRAARPAMHRRGPRRALIEPPRDVHGIDYLEVGPGQLELDVHFMPKETAAGRASLKTMLEQIEATPTTVRVLGGERVRNIRVRKVRRVGARLRVTRRAAGGFLDLHARAEPTRASTRPYASVAFSFKAGCPSRFDCAGDCDCDTPVAASPPIDYMAKDYDSFRQALLDRLPRSPRNGSSATRQISGSFCSSCSPTPATSSPTCRTRSPTRPISTRPASGSPCAATRGCSTTRSTRVQRPRVRRRRRSAAPCTIAAGAQLLTRREMPFRDACLRSARCSSRAASSIAERPAPKQRRCSKRSSTATCTRALNAISIHTWDLGECCLPVGHDDGRPRRRPVVRPIRWQPPGSDGAFVLAAFSCSRRPPASRRAWQPTPTRPTARWCV